MRSLIATTVLSGLIAGPSAAAEMKISITVPRLTVAEYHRPYVAIWLEHADRRVALNLAVWYDLNLDNGEGTKWLKDLRQWWRRSGRNLRMPVDGLSSATRPPGDHEIGFSDTALSGLAAGEYRLVIEAAREVGGREILKVPITWPPVSARQARVEGAHELGAVTVDLKP